jgi:hypothetical protein
MLRHGGMAVMFRTGRSFQTESDVCPEPNNTTNERKKSIEDKKEVCHGNFDSMRDLGLFSDGMSLQPSGQIAGNTSVYGHREKGKSAGQ